MLVERLTDDRLRALMRLESTRTDQNPSVFFLCVHNAGRSQIAAGFMRDLAGWSATREDLSARASRSPSAFDS